MADETAPAPAEEQPPAPAEPAPEPQEPTKADRIAALIRNGLSNSAVSQSAQAWQALETRLPEIVAAILQEA